MATTTTRKRGSTTDGLSLRQRVPVASHAQWRPGHRRWIRSRFSQRVTPEDSGACSASLRAHDAIALFVLSRIGRRHGRRPSTYAFHGHPRAALRRRASGELWWSCDARAQR